MAAGFTVSGLNGAVDGILALGPGSRVLYVQAFNGDPGAGGTSVSNRVSCTFAASSGGSAVGAATNLSVNASSTASWIGLYTASSAGTLVHAYDMPDEVFGSAGTLTVTPTLSVTN